MCREADSMPVFLKSISQCDEWLHITATANHMDNNVHVNGGWLSPRAVLRWCCRYYSFTLRKVDMRVGRRRILNGNLSLSLLLLVNGIFTGKGDGGKKAKYQMNLRSRLYSFLLKLGDESV